MSPWLCDGEVGEEQTANKMRPAQRSMFRSRVLGLACVACSAFVLFCPFVDPIVHMLRVHVVYLFRLRSHGQVCLLVSGSRFLVQQVSVSRSRGADAERGRTGPTDGVRLRRWPSCKRRRLGPRRPA